MIKFLPADERFHTKIGWLDSRHTFSFADHYDPARMGFRALRVINDDHIEKGQGFGPHPHRDMEILTYVLSGAVHHEDSMGNSGLIRAGEVQRMSAGTGVVHSERNSSKTDDLHLLQIWLLPEKARMAPGYEQKVIPPEAVKGKLALIASPETQEGAVVIHQDVRLYAAKLAKGDRVEHTLAAGRHAFVQVARGAITLNAQPMKQGDGAQISDENTLVLEGSEPPAEVLLFDLK